MKIRVSSHRLSIAKLNDVLFVDFIRISSL